MKPRGWTPRVRRFLTDPWEQREAKSWDGAERYDCIDAPTPCHHCGGKKLVRLYSGPRCRRCGHDRKEAA